MNFSRTGPNSASTDTFEVKIAKYHQLHYLEDSETVVIPIEIGSDRVVAVAISSMPITRRQQVKDRIAEALEFLKIPHRFDT